MTHTHTHTHTKVQTYVHACVKEMREGRLDRGTATHGRNFTVDVGTFIIHII